MSLKAFHIVFVTLAIILALIYAVWEYLRFQASGDPLQLVAACIAIVAGAGLVVYGIRFLRKLRKVSFI